MFGLIKLALNRLWPVEPPLMEQGEDPSSMADLVRLLEADGDDGSTGAADETASGGNAS